MAEKLKYMPFYGADFYEDEVVGLMTPAEECAYLRLLWRQWREGSLPREPADLETLARLPLSERVLSRLPIGEDGRRRNSRLEEIRADHLRIKTAQSEGGRAGRMRQLGQAESADSSAKNKMGSPRGDPKATPKRTGAKLGQPDADAESEPDKASSASAAAGSAANAPAGPTATGEAVPPLEYTQRCTAAANRGLRDNPAVGSRCNELVSSNQAGIAGEWQANGVPITVAEQTVYARAMTYQPSSRNPQPRGLAYFTAAVLDAWERTQSQALGQQLTPVALPAGGERGRPKRQSGWERVKAQELAKKQAAHG